MSTLHPKLLWNRISGLVVPDLVPSCMTDGLMKRSNDRFLQLGWTSNLQKVIDVSCFFFFLLGCSWKKNSSHFVCIMGSDHSCRRSPTVQSFSLNTYRMWVWVNHTHTNLNRSIPSLPYCQVERALNIWDFYTTRYSAPCCLMYV